MFVCVCLLLVQNYAGQKSPGLVDSAERCCTASLPPIPLLALLVRVLRQWRVII